MSLPGNGARSFAGQTATQCVMLLMLARWWQLPERVAAVAERLCWAQIECRSAFDLLTDVNYWHSRVLWYVDPLYVLSTRHERYYQHELDAAGHATLLELLDAHPGMVVLAGCPTALYDTRLTHWGWIPTPGGTLAQSGGALGAGPSAITPVSRI